MQNRPYEKWTHQHQSVLHIALNNGLGVTPSIVETLNLDQEPDRDMEYHQHADRDGIHFSPAQFVDKLMKIKRAEKAALIPSLQGSNSMSR